MKLSIVERGRSLLRWWAGCGQRNRSDKPSRVIWYLRHSNTYAQPKRYLSEMGASGQSIKFSGLHHYLRRPPKKPSTTNEVRLSLRQRHDADWNAAYVDRIEHIARLREVFGITERIGY